MKIKYDNMEFDVQWEVDTTGIQLTEIKLNQDSLLEFFDLEMINIIKNKIIQKHQKKKEINDFLSTLTKNQCGTDSYIFKSGNLQYDVYKIGKRWMIKGYRNHRLVFTDWNIKSLKKAKKRLYNIIKNQRIIHRNLKKTYKLSII